MKIKYRDDLIFDPSFALVDGRDGVDGRNGADGVDGRDGVGTDGTSLNPRGEYRRGQVYHRNDLVRTDDGEVYTCLADATKSAPSSFSKSWMLLVQDGETPEAPGVVVQRGPRGRDGSSTPTDIELVFEETAIAGQVMRSSGDGLCAISNALSVYTSAKTIGLAVADTPAGHRGKVRTTGVIRRTNWAGLVGHESLCPGTFYSLNGYGALSPNPCNTAFLICLGLAVDAHTLLIGRYVTYVKPTSNITAPCLSTLPKGSPVYLATVDSVDAASMPDHWQVAGLLTADVEAGNEATYRSKFALTLDDWSSLIGETLLTPNASYYLADVPGMLTTDDADRLYVGRARNTTTLQVSIGDSSPDYFLST